MIYSQLEDIEFGVNSNGIFMINGRETMINKERSLSAKLIQTYTLLVATCEKDLIILADGHEKIRTDGKEGLIFNLSEEGPLKLYRTRDAARE